MRIAIGGIASENSTFNSLPTKLEDFGILRGGDLLESGRYPFLDEYPDVEFIGTLYAGALPGGNVENDAFAALEREFLERLRKAGQVDAVYFDLHGALEVDGPHDAEGRLIESARDIVGHDKLVACSLDLHGKVTDRMAGNLNVATAYRTAPHVDAVETRRRAVDLLIRCLRDGIRPSTTRVGIPMAMPGDITNTNFEPMASVYEMLETLNSEPEVIDASLLIGHCWTDRPYTMANALACGTSAERCHEAAARVAGRFWKHRNEYHYGMTAGSMDGCITRALQTDARPTFITDSGDNPTGGGVGDLVYALERLVARKVPEAVFASVPDPAALDAMVEAGIGGAASVSLGGKLDKIYGKPLVVSGGVERLETVGAGYLFQSARGRQAVLNVDGIKVIVTDRRTPFHRLSQFRRLGIEPLECRLIVVKLGYLQPELSEAAAASFIAMTPGAICQDLPSMPFKAIRRPIYPLDPDMEWQPPEYSTTNGTGES